MIATVREVYYGQDAGVFYAEVLIDGKTHEWHRFGTLTLARKEAVYLANHAPGLVQGPTREDRA